MIRALLVFIAGIIAGVVAHVTWFQSHRPCNGDQLTCQLDWMRAELRLNEDQFTRIRAIHEASSPRLFALAAQVAQMRDEYAAFERERLNDGEVDFLEFARYVEQRRTVDRECLSATRQLVAAASQTLSPSQRQQYLGLVGPALQNGDSALPQ
jgi:uncharacterized membrane protein